MGYQPNKFEALVHYICWKCSDPSKLGAIKLNKVLWFSDTIAFAQIGASITGVLYVKQKFGPVPKPIMPVVRALVQKSILRVEEVKYFGRAKKQYISLMEPDSSIFTADQLEIVDNVLVAITTQHTATSISELTHDAIWKLATIDEVMPHSAILASKFGKISDQDTIWARSRLELLGVAA